MTSLRERIIAVLAQARAEGSEVIAIAAVEAAIAQSDAERWQAAIKLRDAQERKS